MRSLNFMKNMIPLAAVTAVVGLTSGPFAASGYAGPATLAEGGTASLLACRSAETSRTNACTLLDQRDLAFWPQVEAGHSFVLDAFWVSKKAASPKRSRGALRDMVRLSAITTDELEETQADLAGDGSSGEELAQFVDRVRARFGSEARLRPVLRESHIPERAVVLKPLEATSASNGGRHD